jgi:hypothetical protein
MSSDGHTLPITGRRLQTPRAAAIAGIAFALLLGSSLTILWLSVPQDPTQGLDDLPAISGRLGFALGLVPLAGIAFLWFMGVARDRLGDLEDRFFATVLLGSGLLYLGLMFVATGLAGGLLSYLATDPSDEFAETIYGFSRAVTYTIVTTYSMRMAGVFMLTLGTMWWRTATMPRWASIVTYALAIVLLVAVPRSLWAVLVFPLWVLLISTYILIVGRRSDEVADAG